jgi:hypothetical protein
MACDFLVQTKKNPSCCFANIILDNYGGITMSIKGIFRGCFGKDTQIKLADGSEKKASNIRIGDKLVDYTNRILTVSDIITGKDADIYHIKTDKGETKVSSGHPLMREGEYARACDLKVNDKLNTENGRFAVIKNIEVIDYNDTVYNFIFTDVEEGTYLIADGLCSGDLRMQNRGAEKKEDVISGEQEAIMAEMRRFHEENFK